jgi:tetratricopeptide (TPR) repeat protein
MSEQGRRWIERLRRGAGQGEEALRASLAMTNDEGDRELARRLVAVLAEESLADLCVGEPGDAEGQAEAAADASFLGRLVVEPLAGRPCIGELDEVPTLLAILRGGSLLQRRAAALRLRELLENGQLDDEKISVIENVLVAQRDADTAFEVARARAALPGEVGEEARDEDEPWAKLTTDLEKAVRNFWEGETTSEPVALLPGEQRAWLGIRARLLSDSIVAHLCAVLEGCDGVSDADARRALLESLRCAADPRLVPSLVGILENRRPEFVPDAARALARISDPRVKPALLAAYERSVVDSERAVLAGALGLAGDPRGASYLRKLLRDDDPRARFLAVEALEALATSEDVERLGAMVEHADRTLVALVVRALGRIGDARALAVFERLRLRELPSALLAEIEDAESSISAQMELRGEEAPAQPEPSSLAVAARDQVVARGHDEGVWARFRGHIDFALGHVWMAVGGLGRAVAWFELAAVRRPRWPAPLAAIALAHVRQGEPARALGAFRRAIEADRSWVERERFVVRTLAEVVLRRAEEMERAGRLDIARGLLEEVLELDLRRVSSNVRFELRRRRQALTAKAPPGRAA